MISFIILNSFNISFYLVMELRNIFIKNRLIEVFNKKIKIIVNN